MITNRIREILESPDNIEVLHNGNQVWIENIDTATSTAKVRVLENNEDIIVPINELIETGRELK